MLIISLLLPLALAGLALAEEYKYSHAEYLDIVDLFFSVDWGVPLIDCPSGNSEIKRNEIKELMSQGYDKKQIYDIFLDKYGPTVLISPPFSGFNLVVWLSPFLVIIVAGFFIYRYIVQRQIEGQTDEYEIAMDSDDSYERELDQDIMESVIEEEMKKYL